MTEILFRCLVLVSIYLELGKGQDIPYRVTSLSNNPGIYYEAMRPMKMMARTWKIIVALDVQGLVDAQKVNKEQLNWIQAECKVPGISNFTCIRDLQINAFKKTEEEAGSLQEHLKQLLRSNESGRRKKREPIFGFISRILGPVVGFTDYTQHNQLVEQVKKLYEDKDTITRIIANSTHILQSEIDGQQNYLNQTTQNIKLLREETQMIKNTLGGAINRLNVLEMRLQLIHLGNEAMEGVKHYSDTLRKIVRIVEDVKHGIINPDLISHEKLIQAAREIVTSEPELDLPFDPENPDLALLTRISDLHLLHSEGKLISVVTVPLFNKTPMKMFRMIPCKAPQQLALNTTGSAFIQPSLRYIALSLDQQHYFKFDSEYLQKCTQKATYNLCPVHSLQHQKEASCCESDLLIRPSVEVMKNCDVKILRQHRIQWTRLEESLTWLFSTAETVSLTVICKGLRSYSTEIAGTGILHLQPDCEAHTSTDILRSAGITETQMPDIHVVPLTLNLTMLSPQLTEEIQLPNLLKEIKIDPLPNNTNAENDMRTVQHTLEILTKHKFEEYNSDNVHLGITGCIGVTTVVIIAVLVICICKGWCPPINCCPSSAPVMGQKITSQPVIPAPKIIYQPRRIEKRDIEILRPAPEPPTLPAIELPTPEGATTSSVDGAAPEKRREEEKLYRLPFHF